MSANPILIEVVRGPLSESVHRGALAVADADGGFHLRLGDTARAVYPRSAIKALQALPLIETGAADGFGFDDAELAIACASHSGEAEHVEAARSLLQKSSISETALACGAHWPLGDEAARRLAAAGGSPRPIHNNCSGKHAGMLAQAKHLGETLEGYERPGHPVQKRVRAVIEEMSGASLTDAVCAIDGCSVPTWAMPLEALASTFAKFATGTGLALDRAQACARLRRACAAHPSLVAGAGRYCTDAMSLLGPGAFIKVGAEGVYCAALPGQGLGIALKIDDGGRRAAELVTAAVLRAFLGPQAAPLVAPGRLQLRNWRGSIVGEIRVADELRAALTSAAL